MINAMSSHITKISSTPLASLSLISIEKYVVQLIINTIHFMNLIFFSLNI